MFNVSEATLKSLADFENQLEEARKNLNQIAKEAHDFMKKECPQFDILLHGNKFRLFDDRNIFGKSDNIYMKLKQVVPPTDDQKNEFPCGFNAVVVKGGGAGAFVYIKSDYVIPE